MTARNGQQPITPAAQAALDEALAKIRKLVYDEDSRDYGEGGLEGATESKPTDDELAQQWLSLYPDSAFGLGNMRRYRNGVWEVLPDDVFERELLEVLETNKESGIRPSSRLLASVKKLAQVKASVPDYVWDADPNILICANGTLELDKIGRAHV